MLTHCEFAFLYHAHYWLFNFFYVCHSDPCLGIEKVKEISLLFDSTLKMFYGGSGDWI